MVCNKVNESLPPDKQTRTLSPGLIISKVSIASKNGLKMSFVGGIHLALTFNVGGFSGLFVKIHASMFCSISKGSSFMIYFLEESILIFNQDDFPSCIFICDGKINVS